MALSYRKATKNDWETVASLGKSVDDPTYKSITKENEVKDYVAKSEVFIVHLGGRPIGTISYEAKSDKHAYIDGLTVHPRYQRKGYTSNALDWLLGQLKDYQRVDMVTHPQNNTSTRFYLKFGFKIEAWKDNYFGDGEPRLILFKRNY